MIDELKELDKWRIKEEDRHVIFVTIDSDKVKSYIKANYSKKITLNNRNY